jgi:hypothetical protein
MRMSRKTGLSEGRSRLLPATIVTLLALAGPGHASARPESAPVATAPPTLAGDAGQGSRLTVSRGSWSGAIAFAYTWYRCDTMGGRCTVLNGVTAKSHRLGGNDVGHTIRVAVHAFDANGTATAFASLVGPVAGPRPGLAPRLRPAVSGTAVEGGTVHVEPGAWHPRPAAFDYQWLRCTTGLHACSPIAGATTDSHDVGADDLGHQLVAIVQARWGTKARAVFSDATAVAARPGAAGGPTSSAGPAVAEVLQVGGVLTASPGSWSGSGAVSFAYQWYRCDGSGAHCLSIHGATGLTYTEVAKDVGKTIGFAVHATDKTGTSTVYAGLVGPVAAAASGLAATAQPVVSGSATPGQVVQVSNGSWNGVPGSFGYQWLRCNANGRLCAAIEGATASAYTVQAADGGHVLVATVHAVAGDASQDALSTRAGPVQ